MQQLFRFYADSTGSIIAKYYWTKHPESNFDRGKIFEEVCAICMYRDDESIRKNAYIYLKRGEEWDNDHILEVVFHDIP